MTQDSFSKRVVKIALSIPEGKVTTYGRIAHAAGGGAIASQSITSILAKATTSGVRNIPYHRIVYSDGRVWMDPTHRRKRLALYKKEGIKLDKTDRIINFKDVLI
jgi:methylated-DNA-protein-cysteine methyltransferase-like protein